MSEGSRTYLLRLAQEFEFECLLCKAKVIGQEPMVQHLQNHTCQPGGDPNSFAEIQRHMMIQNVKWRISFLKWHHFREIIKDNKRDEFEAVYLDHCVGCMTWEAHRDGGCESRVKKGLIVSHLAKEAYEHYYAWATADHNLNEMALNKAHEEKIEKANFQDLVYIADELWPEMRANEEAAMKRFDETVAKFRKELMNIHTSEQRLFARLDAGEPAIPPRERAPAAVRPRGARRQN